MDKKYIEKRFKELEKKLKTILKENSIDDIEKYSKNQFLSKMKEYIKNINEVDEMFNEYEMLADMVADDDEVDCDDIMATLEKLELIEEEMNKQEKIKPTQKTKKQTEKKTEQKQK